MGALAVLSVWAVGPCAHIVPGEFFRGTEPRASVTAENYPAPGAEFSGAPPTETGPTGSGNRDVFLRDVPTERA
jgi:hypothetical protein